MQGTHPSTGEASVVDQTSQAIPVTGDRNSSCGPWGAGYLSKAVEQILEGGKSAELRSIFALIQDAGMEGEPRFTPRVAQELATCIVCRNYAPALLELSHLLLIIDNWFGRPDRFEDFFWGTELARPGVFRGRFSEEAPRNPAQVEAIDNGIELVLSDGRFGIAYSRMCFLAALVEFLMSALGYEQLAEYFAKVRATGLDKASVSNTSNELSKKLYAYLNDHLPPAQQQRKFHQLIDFLSQQIGPEFDRLSIDDDALLTFWQRYSDCDGDDACADFRTYAAVYRAFVHLRQALATGDAETALHLPLGTDIEAGEISPELLSEMLEIIQQHASPLRTLREPPAEAVKFLNKKEQNAVGLLIESGEEALSLRLSYLRCRVFGGRQAQLTQALRRQPSRDELADMATNPPDYDYQGEIDLLQHMLDHLRRVQLATLHALHEDAAAEAMLLAEHLAPDANLSHFAQGLAVKAGVDLGNNVVPFPGQNGGDGDGLLAQAAKSFRGLSRQGFEIDHVRELRDAYVAGAQALMDLDKRLNTFMRKGLRPPPPAGDWQAQFESDHSLFSAQFERLYVAGFEPASRGAQS